MHPNKKDGRGICRIHGSPAEAHELQQWIDKLELEGLEYGRRLAKQQPESLIASDEAKQTRTDLPYSRGGGPATGRNARGLISTIWNDLPSLVKFIDSNRFVENVMQKKPLSESRLLDMSRPPVNTSILRAAPRCGWGCRAWAQPNQFSVSVSA